MSRLFDDGTVPVEPGPMARHDHPETSKEAADAMRGSKRLTQLQRVTLRLLAEAPGGPSTTFGLAVRGGTVDERTYGRRLSELRKAGLVQVVGTGHTPAGRHCQLWEATERGRQLAQRLANR